MSATTDAMVRQFGKPEGPLGRLAGLIMRLRPSNRLRGERTLELLEIRPADRILEIGFGPGLAVARAAELARAGRVVGLDHSELMVREARRRNAGAIRAGRVELLLGSADALPPLDAAPFDKVMAVNVYMFWKDPVSVLRGLLAVLRPGGTIALTLQPRRPGATPDESRAAAARMSASLREAGFDDVRTVMLEMAPVPAACVMGRGARR